MSENQSTEATYFLPSEGLSAWASRPFLEKITGLVPNIIYIFNQQTQTSEYSNRSLGEALGYSFGEVAAMGEAFMPTLCHAEDLPKVFEHFLKIAKMEDGEILTIEYRMKHRNGGWVWLLSHDTVFERDESGAVLRHIGTAADITSQKEAEIKADAATRELQSFAYSVSHDLKSPTNTLSMLINEVKRSQGSKLNADGKQLLDLTLQTIERMQNVINDVANYTSVFDTAPVSDRCKLSDVIGNAISDLQSEVVDSAAIIDLQDLPEISGNPIQIRLLFQNLIANALKYRHVDRAPSISITDSSESSAPGALVSISVTDNGIGIPADKFEQVFTIFSRLHGDREYSTGSGLGLAVCKRIALTHDADISVSSEVGVGSTFTITFKGIA